MKKEFISTTVEQTFAFGVQLMQDQRMCLSNNSVVFLLNGPMGSGKTELTKGIAEACHIIQPILSPTYTIAREYIFQHDGKSLRFLHADLWRMQSVSELKDANIQGVIEEPSVVVIEWSDMFEKEILSILNEKKIHLLLIKCSYGKNETDRVISVETYNE